MSPLPPADLPLAAFVEGLLDGRVADAAALQAATRELSSAGGGPFRCDVQGGRFSLLPVDTTLPPGFDDAAQERFLAALHRVVASSVPGSVEGNLRCRLVFADEVTETLFVVRGDRIEPLSRRRPRTPDDAVPAMPAAPPTPFGLRRRELAWIAPLLLLAGAAAAWQGGWIDRVLAARAEGLQRDAGPFSTMLAFDVERSWGNYHVTLRRGADYPTTPQAVEDRRRGAADHAASTATSIVGDGRELYVQVVDGAGHVLAETRVDVRPLLTAADAVVTTTLPGRIGAAAMRLSITAAPRPQ